jgi:sugar-specific transcriptional regulator TrmB
MHEELLSEIGLSKSEISVYFALLNLGGSTTGPIIKRAGIASGKAYLVLDKLVLKGLVSYSIKGGVKYFQAKDPERLTDYLGEKIIGLQKKQEKLRAAIPGLKAKFEEQKFTPIAETFEGLNGLKTFYEWVLKELSNGEKIEIFGAPKNVLEKLDTYFLDWNKRRVQRGISLKILYNHNCRIFGAKRARMNLTEVRYLKEEMETPAWIVIFKDYVVTINFFDVPVCFLFKNPQAAESYQKYFSLLWKQSEK